MKPVLTPVSSPEFISYCWTFSKMRVFTLPLAKSGIFNIFCRNGIVVLMSSMLNSPAAARPYPGTFYA
jgi:hypothetical protein